MLPRLRVVVLVTVGLLGMIGLAGCGSLPGDAAAKVNDKIITKDDVARRIESLRTVYGPMVPDETDTELFSNYQREVTDQLVREELERAETEKRGITVTEAEIDQRLQEIADDQFLGDMDKLFQEFELKGLTREDMRADLRRTILHEKMQAEIGKDIVVTDQDALDYFERNKGQYVQPERRQLRQLVAADEATAQAAVQRSRAGEDFLNLVVELSTDPEAAVKKGAVGLIIPGQLAPELDKAAYSLTVGAVSDPVRVGEQWYVLRVENVIAPINTTFDEVKEDVKSVYGSQQFSARWKEFVAQVYDDATIDFAEQYDPAFKTEEAVTTPEAATTPVQ